MLPVPTSPPPRPEVPPRVRAALEKAGLSPKDFCPVRTKSGAVVTLVRRCTFCDRDLDRDGECGRAYITQAGSWRCNRRGCGAYHSSLRKPDGGLDIAVWHEQLGVGKLKHLEIELAQLEGELHGAFVRFTRKELEATPPEQRWLLHPYIPAGRVVVLAGPGGTLKTTLAVQLAVWRALGLPLFGQSMPPGRTVIFSAEDRREDYLRKIAACRSCIGEFDFDASAVAAGVSVVDVSGLPEAQRLVHSQYGQFSPTALADALAAVIQQRAPFADLVVMETISRLAGGAEGNDSLSMTVAAAERLARLTGCAVLLVAHVSQEVGRRGIADAYAPRGGSALSDNARSVLVMARPGNEGKGSKGKGTALLPPGAKLSAEQLKRLVVLAHAKSNAAPPAAPLYLEPVSTQYGPVLEQVRISRGATDPMAQYTELRDLVERLTAQNIVVTERKLRDYAEDLGVPQRQLGRLVDGAVMGHWLERSGKTGRGGGQRLVPGAGPPTLTLDDETQESGDGDQGNGATPPATEEDPR